MTKLEPASNGTPEVLSLTGSPPGGSTNMSPQSTSPQVVFKRPGDPVSLESPVTKRARVVEEGRPLREIHSVMMTTSGFLSPAREGKLPEARTPQQARSDSPPPSSYPMVPPELKCEKKPKKLVSKKDAEERKLDKENKKKDRAKELFKPDKIDDSKVKKLAGMKELAKLKALKPGGGKAQAGLAGPSARPLTPKLSPPKPANSPKPPKVTQPKTKVEKSEPSNAASGLEKKDDNVDKLPSEPDKQKLNIFKKISKPRDDKEKELSDNKYKNLDSRESSPGLVIDENNEKLNRRHEAESKPEEKKTPHTPDVHNQPDSGDLTGLQSPSSDVYMFDDMSPPGTPSTPKTPELNVPVLNDQKKKRKEKGKKKETKSKSPKQCISPKKVATPVTFHPRIDVNPSFYCRSRYPTIWWNPILRKDRRLRRRQSPSLESQAFLRRYRFRFSPRFRRPQVSYLRRWDTLCFPGFRYRWEEELRTPRCRIYLCLQDSLVLL